MLPVNSGATLSREVTGLDKYTEYEFQVLAFTSVGDGPKSSVELDRTHEDGKKYNCRLLEIVVVIHFLTLSDKYFAHSIDSRYFVVVRNIDLILRGGTQVY